MSRAPWKSSVTLSGRHFNDSQPWWADYQPLLAQIDREQITGCERLNTLLPDGLQSQGGHSIRFVPSTELGDTGYEYRIYTTGRVSTRPDNWHDLFNALVWMRFPRIKVAMNALHYRAWDEQHDGRRGKVRDALTLFDECGVIVVSASADNLQALAQRRWKDAFLADDFGFSTHVLVCGHAMLEKYLAPYKSMTAKALLLHVGEDVMSLSRNRLLAHVDDFIADRMLAGALLTEPADLSPLPLAGVPGWWQQQQDQAFYDDLQVFRPPPANLRPVPVLEP